jgi:hypothetical protein
MVELQEFRTNAWLFGGDFRALQYTNTEFWNGTAWTEVADLATARDH